MDLGDHKVVMKEEDEVVVMRVLELLLVVLFEDVELGVIITPKSLSCSWLELE